MLREGSRLWMARGLGISVVVVCWSGRTYRAAASSCAEGAAKRTRRAERKSSARGVTARNYSSVGSFGETEAINGPPRREADWATTLHSACGASDSPCLTRLFGGW
jgi:hypothetical protein